MLKLITKAQARFMKDEEGATAIEYGLIAVGIALAILLAVQAVGTELTGTFEDIDEGLASRPTTGG